MIPTRTVVQIRTHAQKYFQKLLKSNKIHDFEEGFVNEFKLKAFDDSDSDRKPKQYRPRSDSSSSSMKLGRAKKFKADNDILNDSISTVPLSDFDFDRFTNQTVPYDLFPPLTVQDCIQSTISKTYSSDCNESEVIGVHHFDDLELSWLSEVSYDSLNVVSLSEYVHNQRNSDGLKLRQDSVATSSEASDHDDSTVTYGSSSPLSCSTDGLHKWSRSTLYRSSSLSGFDDCQLDQFTVKSTLASHQSQPNLSSTWLDNGFDMNKSTFGNSRQSAQFNAWEENEFLMLEYLDKFA